MALDPEMVVGFTGKFALAIAAFEYALGQGDTGRDAIGLHFKLGDGGESADIFFNAGNGNVDKFPAVPGHCSARG